MSRTRIVKGNITKIIRGSYKRYSKDNIENVGSKVIQVGKDEGVRYGINEEPPKPAMLNFSEPILNGDIIFCNGYLSSPKKNPGSYLNVIVDKVPDDVSQKPMRGANMNEKRLTDDADIYTNDELEKDNRRGGGALYSDSNYETTETYRWIFAAKEKFEGYWKGYNNVTDIVDWARGDEEYDGSGWAHGARRKLAEAIGLTDGNINSLFEAGIYSMLQSGEVDISSSKRLIKMINEDPAFVQYEKEIAEMIFNDFRYKKDSFTTKEIIRGIQLGGKRAKGDMLDQFKNPFSAKYRHTWKVAANELTWLLRSITLSSIAHVDKNGNVKIFHKFKDVFDLRPSDDGSRSIEYDVVSIITGFLYHDIAG